MEPTIPTPIFLLSYHAVFSTRTRVHGQSVAAQVLELDDEARHMLYVC